jgi:hypothetical protein
MPDLEDCFPALRGRSYRITSPNNDEYNCVAWVLRDTSRWWEPAVDGFYWPRQIDPDDLDPDEDLAEYLRMFVERGFNECEDGQLETDVEKIAIFASGSSFEHVAYQAPDGQWSSKMGPFNDIRHPLVADLVGTPPGGFTGVATYLARPRLSHELADTSTGILLP